MRPASWLTARRIAAVGALFVASTLVVAFLENATGAQNASIVYLVAIVVAGLWLGTGGAIATAVIAFGTYTFFFTEPVHTFRISDPEVLISAVLFLFVGVVIGQLAAVQGAREAAATAREREARALFGLSRVLATREDTAAALARIAAVLRDETGMRRVWIALGPDAGAERTIADTEPGGGAPPATARHRVLQRMPGDEPARWSLLHPPSGGRRPAAPADEVYRIRIEASGDALGSVWATRDRGLGEPDRVGARLLAAAADQLGQAIARDRVQDESRTAEVARQSDRLKSSLLQSVSHDFRTPLAVIRAAAGSLGEESDLSADDRRANVAAIDREVEYLNRLVANLLDLSRIEAGSLRAHAEVYDIDDVLGQALERVASRLGGRTLETAVEPLPVRVDPVFLDASVANLLDNAVKYTPPTARIRVRATALAAADSPTGADAVRLTIDDDGPGVPPDAIGQLFRRFYRVEEPGGSGARAVGGARGGLGIGLAVVRGLVEAMGGHVGARPGELGGLAIDVDLPAAHVAEAVA